MYQKKIRINQKIIIKITYYTSQKIIMNDKPKKKLQKNSNQKIKILQQININKITKKKQWI